MFQHLFQRGWIWKRKFCSFIVSQHWKITLHRGAVQGYRDVFEESFCILQSRRKKVRKKSLNEPYSMRQNGGKRIPETRPWFSLWFLSIHLQLSLDSSLFWRSHFSLKSSKEIVGSVKGRDKESGDRSCASATTAILACEAWQFCCCAQTSKGERGRWKCEEIGTEATRRLLFSCGFAARSRELLQLRHSVLRPT